MTLTSHLSAAIGDWLLPAAGRRAGPILCLLLALSLPACFGQPGVTEEPLVPTQAAGPTSVAPASEPTSTSLVLTSTAPQPAPTATMIASARTTPSPAPAACQFSWFFVPAPDACPAGQPTISAAAEQPFENGVMIWLEASDSIIVLHHDGRWQRFEDTWSEGEPESDPNISPPAGRFQPIRGFGKLWRQQPGVRDALGWALGVELGYESTLQEQVPDPDRPAVTYVRTYNGQIVALVGRAPDQGDWVVAADNR